MRCGESNKGSTGLANVECVWIASKCIQKVGKNTEVSVVMQERGEVEKLPSVVTPTSRSEAILGSPPSSERGAKRVRSGAGGGDYPCAIVSEYEYTPPFSITIPSIEKSLARDLSQDEAQSVSRSRAFSLTSLTRLAYVGIVASDLPMVSAEVIFTPVTYIEIHTMS
jgi:hypothetical protein